jgi:hypothetical protein
MAPWLDIVLLLHCALRRKGLGCPHLRHRIVELVRERLWREIVVEDEFLPMLIDGHIRLRTPDSLFQRMPPMLATGRGAREDIVIARLRDDNDINRFLHSNTVYRCIYDLATYYGNEYTGFPSSFYMSYFQWTLTKEVATITSPTDIFLNTPADLTSNYVISDTNEDIASALLLVDGVVVEEFRFDAARRQWTVACFSSPYPPFPLMCLYTYAVSLRVLCRCRTMLTVNCMAHYMENRSRTTMRSHVHIIVDLPNNKQLKFLTCYGGVRVD